MHQQDPAKPWKALGSGPHPECPRVPQGQISSSESSATAKTQCKNDTARLMKREGFWGRRMRQRPPWLPKPAPIGRTPLVNPVYFTHRIGRGICQDPGIPAPSHWSLPKSRLKTVCSKQPRGVKESFQWNKEQICYEEGRFLGIHAPRLWCEFDCTHPDLSPSLPQQDLAVGDLRLNVHAACCATKSHVSDPGLG